MPGIDGIAAVLHARLRGRARAASAASVALACACALWLGGCATPRAPAEGSVGAGSCPLQYAGRISVVEQGAQPHQLYGSFTLRLDAGTGSLELGSPLGQMLARASWDGTSASVDDGHAVRGFSSFEDMTQATLGLRLPRAALQDWVRARPSPSLPWRALDGGGFEQLGWQVRATPRDGEPHVLRLSRDTADGSEQLGLVIDQRQGGDCASAGPAS